MNTKTFVIMGRPGSGKSVQARLLSEQTGFKVFSPGERYREVAKENTSIGRKVKALIDAGRLGPHWLSIYFFQDALFHLNDIEGIIFEGIGRKREEAEKFHEAMEWLSRDYIVFDIGVPETEVVERLNKRREKESRTDDDEEDIPVRIAEYDKHTASAIEFFTSVGKVVPINGDQTIEEVHREIVEKAGL
jgi:adenylate kinase